MNQYGVTLGTQELTRSGAESTSTSTCSATRQSLIELWRFFA